MTKQTRTARLGDKAAEDAAHGTCRGTRVAYGRRPGQELHPVGVSVWGACWFCHQFGCSTCTGSTNVLEVLCQRCAAWGTREAFQHHGPILNDPSQVAKRRGVRAPEFKDYPDAWKRGYRDIDFGVSQSSLEELVDVATRKIATDGPRA